MTAHQRGLAFQAEIACRRSVTVNRWLFRVHALVMSGLLTNRYVPLALAFTLPQPGRLSHVGALPRFRGIFFRPGAVAV
jgi:hypothetical protein